MAGNVGGAKRKKRKHQQISQDKIKFTLSSFLPSPFPSLAPSSPSGWWHLVVNTEESLAITQNYVCRSNLPHVLSFLEKEPHLVSGLPDADRPLLYSRFVEVLRQACPEVLDQAQEERQQARRARKEEGEKKKRGRVGGHGGWSAVVGRGDDGDKEEKEEGKEEAKELDGSSTKMVAKAKKKDEGGGGVGFQFGFSFGMGGGE